MTEQKSLKRRVRERMAKTGERYTAARRHVVGSTDFAMVADPGVSDEAVTRATGKSWCEWIEILDAWGARERPHRDIARYVAGEHGVPGWWAQSVTVGYERARGLRAPGQRRDGGFEVNVSRTVAVPAEELLAAFVSPAMRKRWFPAAPLRPRPTRARLGARFDWEDGPTRVVVYVTHKGAAKSSVAVQHVGLASKQEAAALRALWRERLGELKRVLES